MKKPPYADFASRLYTAQKRYELKTGRDLDRGEFGKAVAKLAGRGTPLSDSTVSNWFTGKQMPVVKQLEAIGKVLGVHPGWLAFGSDDTITTPDSAEPIAASGNSPQGRRPPNPPGRK